ncbi:hypothetical protein niasHT_033258 [Heterodera trifolii]|uniref:UBX domain-containing protein 4 n=1 Tax=Heterodera trifolii TaxID=157864 RepID=A0ABD2ING9_9BILA
MEWYSGDVTTALNIYQEKKGILVVYVYSDDVNSTKFDQIWESFDHSLLDRVPYVAIRLAKDTEGANQFAQFFPTPVFPVCYFLGLNAQPLEVLTAVEEMTIERLNSSLAKAISLYNDQMKEQGFATNAVSFQSKSSENDSGKNTSENVPETLNATSNDEKLEYYRKRLEEKHKEDAMKKEQEEREKEIMRRNEGKAIAEVREKQRERELKEMAEQRRKQKEEDAQALKRIREQLQQDKEERAKRTAGGTIPTETESKAPEVVEPIRAPVNSEQCRIQCKFPDGSTLTDVFPSDSPLQVVHDAVSRDLRAPPNFFLVQPYPRKKLNEFEKTLLELDLTPSSAILVLAQKNAQQSVLPSNAYLNMAFGIFNIPFYFVGTLWRFITSFFVVGRPSPTSDQQGQNPTQNSSGGQKREGAKTERSGNVGSFRADESDHSDDEATWNGNSTQQL